MTQYAVTTIAMSIHPANESPVYSEDATHVCLEDEGSGPFISIKQTTDQAMLGEVRLDLHELQLVLAAARKLLP